MILAARGVTKAFGDHQALAGVDLDVEAGEICALLGVNGAGKTTFASIVAGLLRADTGSVHVAGLDVVRDTVQVRRHLGYAPQELGIYPLHTVRENLVLFGELAGMRGAELDRRIGEVAEPLGLTPLLKRQAGRMSGGEQRRLHTAMALLHKPDLVMLDEPTVGADVQTRAALLDFVQELAKDGMAVLYTTHYLAEVEALDATVALIDRGQVIQRGSVARLVATYATSVVRLRFEGPAPQLTALDLDADASVEAAEDVEVLQVRTPAPTVTAAAILAHLDPADSARVRDIELIRPGLEAAFTALTGRVFQENNSHVAA